MRRTLAVLLCCLAIAGCGVKLPPITITLPRPQPAPANTTPPAPVPTPEPPPVDVTPAEPDPPKAPLQNLNLVVHDAAGVGIARAVCAVAGPNVDAGVEERVADGGGFINYAVRGSVAATCSAPGFVSRQVDIPPGDHRIGLIAVAPTAPTPPPAPTPVMSAIACSSTANRNGVSHGCLEAVSRTSVFYATCQITGAVEACHHYVREVVRALKAATGSDRWGLLKKGGGDNFEGYGTDVIAYLPERFALDARTWQWLGVDVIGGIGAPGARFIAGNFNPVISCADWKEGMSWCQREGDIWAPVPQ